MDTETEITEDTETETEHTEIPTLASMIRDNGITMVYSTAGYNPAMPDSPHMTRHWKITLRCSGRAMTLIYSQGSAHTEDPEIRDVIGCLLSDSSGYDNARDFREWCAEYGYSADRDDPIEKRLAARVTYKAVARQRDDLIRLLGPDLYAAMLDTDPE